jgi:hypothetical protein
MEHPHPLNSLIFSGLFSGVSRRRRGSSAAVEARSDARFFFDAG